MPTRRLAQPNRELTEEDLPKYVEEYLKTRRMADEVTKRADAQKAVLAAYVDTHGEPDDKGSLWLEVGVEGAAQLKREKRVSTGFDPDVCERYLRKQGVFDDYTETIVRLDEDKVTAAVFEGKLPEREYKKWVTRSETFAFKVVK